MPQWPKSEPGSSPMIESPRPEAHRAGGSGCFAFARPGHPARISPSHARGIRWMPRFRTSAAPSGNLPFAHLRHPAGKIGGKQIRKGERMQATDGFGATQTTDDLNAAEAGDCVSREMGARVSRGMGVRASCAARTRASREVGSRAPGSASTRASREVDARTSCEADARVPHEASARASHETDTRASCDAVRIMRELIDVAEGRMPADTVFVNAQVVDVYRLRCARGQVAVKDGCIAAVLFEGRDCPDASAPAWQAAQVVDCGGRYLAPASSTPTCISKARTCGRPNMRGWPWRGVRPARSPTATRSPTCVGSTACRS